MTIHFTALVNGGSPSDIPPPIVVLRISVLPLESERQPRFDDPLYRLRAHRRSRCLSTHPRSWCLHLPRPENTPTWSMSCHARRLHSLSPNLPAMAATSRSFHSPAWSRRFVPAAAEPARWPARPESL